jgi:hypothetical protein
MRLPIYVKSLLGLLRDVGGFEQREVATHLKVTPSTVSTWATGKRPIPRRHFLPLLRLVNEVVQQHADVHEAQLKSYIRAWDLEMAAGVGAISFAIKTFFEQLKSSYALEDPVTMDPEQRRHLRTTCRFLVINLEYLDRIGQPAPFEDFFGQPPPQEYLRNICQVFDIVQLGDRV